MFDWARGSMMPHLIKANLNPFVAEWDDRHMSDWLRNWSFPWFLGAIEFRRGLRILDVGSGNPQFAQYLHTTFGCEAHALDMPSETTGVTNWGINQESNSQYPDVTTHYGLAGQDRLPAEQFDAVYCNSVMEHTYDARDAVDPSAPLAHQEVLRDMVRMLRPGGLLLMNWDTFLDGVPHHLGWEYESDFWLLHHCGMRLADPRRRIRSGRYIYDHPDSLFFSPKAFFTYNSPTSVHATSINAIWRKPGGELPTRLVPRPELEAAYFPAEEIDPSRRHNEDPLSSEEIDARFKHHIAQARRALGGRFDGAR
jgi:SAM-dependent methyltransferase